MKTASWVIREIDSGAVVFETFNEELLKVLNTSKYEAVPIFSHLVALNKSRQKAKGD